MNYWHGWFIEQSLEDQSVFNKFSTVKMKSDEVDWKEHIVEISDDQIQEVVSWLENNLKHSWYAHAIKGDEIIIIFKGKSFRLKRGDSFEKVAEYSRSLKIPEDQLPDVSLFELARESGF